MTTLYVNVNNAYVTVGDGSIGNQFNYQQFVTQYGLPGSNLFLLTGKLNGVGDGTYSSIVLNGGTHSIDSQDITSPWVLIVSGGISSDKKINFSGYSDLNNGIIDAISNFLSGDVAGTINIGVDAFSSSVSNIYAKNIYAYANYTISVEADYVDVKGGCLLMDLYMSNPPMVIVGDFSGTAASPRIIVHDTIIVAPSLDIENGSNAGASNDFSSVVFNLSMGNVASGMIAPVVLTNPQYGWAPATVLPTGASIPSAFLEQTIAPDGGGSEITVPATGSFSGYTKGLFGGGDRTVAHGIGAFTFAAPTPPTPPALLAPAWVAGTYATNIIVTYNGAFWISNTSTSATPGADGTWVQYADIGQIIEFVLNRFNQN